MTRFGATAGEPIRICPPRQAFPHLCLLHVPRRDRWPPLLEGG